MSGPIVPPLTVSDEADGGSVSGRPITTIEVTSGTLTVSGRTATLDTSGSGGSPGTPAKSVQFNSDPAGTFTGSSQLLYETAANAGRIEMSSGAVATQPEIRTMTGRGLQISATDADESIRNQIVVFGENDAPDGIALYPATGLYVQVGDSTSTPAQITTRGATANMVLTTNLTEDKAKITLTAGADGDVLVQTDNAGVLQLENTTTDADSVLSIMGNGTGDAKLDLQNASKRVWVLCDENKKLKIQGGAAGNTFVFDVTSATGGITFPDATTLISAEGTAILATGVTDGYVLTADGAGASAWEAAGGGGSGDVTGPGSSTDNAIARFDGTGGKTLQNSGPTIDDSGNLTIGDDTGNAYFSNHGSHDIIIWTNEGTNSGKIRVRDGLNADISIDPNGTGAVEISAAYKLPTAVTGSNDYVLTAQTDGSTAWAAAGGGATELSGLSDVLIDATNWVGGFLIQTNSGGSAPTTGTLSSANQNIGIGSDVLKSITTADRTLALGEEAAVGLTTGTDNVVLGSRAMSTFPGVTTGTQRHNVAIGTYCMSAILNGAAENIGIGSQTLNSALEGEGNTVVGTFAGDVTTGNRNLILGVSGGNTISTGSDNVVLGGLDVDDGTADNQLVIASGDGTPFWIKGDSAGSCYQGDNATTWSTTSDRRLKREIVDATVGLDAINAVQVRNFRYVEKAEPIIETETSESGLEHERIVGYEGENRYNLDPEPVRVGVIAQEFREVFPDGVKENLNGHLTVNPDSMNWALIKAVQELSAKVEALEASQ